MIASRIEPFIESVREGKDGILFEAGNSEDLQKAIVKFFENRDDMVNAWTGKNVQINSWENLAKVIYEMAAASKGHP